MSRPTFLNTKPAGTLSVALVATTILDSFWAVASVVTFPESVHVSPSASASVAPGSRTRFGAAAASAGAIVSPSATASVVPASKVSGNAPGSTARRSVAPFWTVMPDHPFASAAAVSVPVTPLPPT